MAGSPQECQDFDFCEDCMTQKEDSHTHIFCRYVYFSDAINIICRVMYYGGGSHQLFRPNPRKLAEGHPELILRFHGY